MSVRIETNIGNFIVELFVEEAPKACLNFLKLCRLGYYDYTIFLRCEPNFLLQGGDPSNSGSGGCSLWHLLDAQKHPSRFFPDEIDVKKRKHLLRGTLSMASAGKDRNASQFFITLADKLDFLDGTCTIFGQLTSAHLNKNPGGAQSKEEGGAQSEETGGAQSKESGGAQSLDSDAFFDFFNEELFCDEAARPYQDVFITKTVILSDPFPDPEGFTAFVTGNPMHGSKNLEAFNKHKRIGAHEALNDSAGKTEAEIEADLRERAAKSNALVLELIGDLPSADVKPPENVLFVCKLNPITRSDDLQMIFSRFGKIVSCEVIKDRDSGASLGYAFIEFDEKEACEQAYLKMDNVLIDDKRIKVDFSQSVSKLHRQWEDKRRNGINKSRSRYEDRTISNRERQHENRSIHNDRRRHEDDRSRSKRYDDYSHDRTRYSDRSEYEEKRHSDRGSRGDYNQRDKNYDRSKSPQRR
jgi:peptidyl-prolyl cis-trans isomerase-like 4